LNTALNYAVHGPWEFISSLTKKKKDPNSVRIIGACLRSQSAALILQLSLTNLPTTKVISLSQFLRSLPRFKIETKLEWLKWFSNSIAFVCAFRCQSSEKK